MAKFAGVAVVLEGGKQQPAHYYINVAAWLSCLRYPASGLDTFERLKLPCHGISSFKFHTPIPRNFTDQPRPFPTSQSHCQLGTKGVPDLTFPLTLPYIIVPPPTTGCLRSQLQHINGLLAARSLASRAGQPLLPRHRKGQPVLVRIQPSGSGPALHRRVHSQYASFTTTSMPACCPVLTAPSRPVLHQHRGSRRPCFHRHCVSLLPGFYPTHLAILGELTYGKYSFGVVYMFCGVGVYV